MKSLILLIVAAPAFLGAQASRVTVRVHVVDSVRTPVAGVDVAIMKGLSETLARATTDSSGRRVLTYDPGAGDVEIVARRIGFARASRYVRAKSGDTISVELTLSRVAQTLEAVKVTDRQDLKRKSYFIDADEIGNSKRNISDALDVISKLRPDMIYGRTGPKICPPTLRVWVNGIRIRWAVPSARLMERKRMITRAASVSSRTPLQGVDALPLFVQSVLGDIKAEHIAEIRYTDCMDSSVGKIGGESAVFIVLKPGIGFQPGTGSFVSDAGVVYAGDKGLADTTPDSVVSVVLSYRHRLLGVYDNSTGDPLEGVAVIDSITNTRAMTTPTGTVTLAFLPDGVSAVRLEKPGYIPRSLMVSISAQDTLPLTIVLERRP